MMVPGDYSMSSLLRFQPCHLGTILIPPSGETEDNNIRLGSLGGDSHGLDNSMRRFQSGNYPLQAATDAEAFQASASSTLVYRTRPWSFQ